MEQEKIYSFLHLYEEDKNLAIWAINNNPKVFDVKKSKEAFYLPSTLYDKVPLWKDMQETNIFPKISTNEQTIKRLKGLGMTEKNISSFLHMYEENKNLAVWSINNNSKVFNIKKPEKAFTLRKVELVKVEEKTLTPTQEIKQNQEKPKIIQQTKDIDR
ncbi:hypothetical protein ABSA28_00182 [Candidatus Hepatincolaceae symbiont of Richtersius coronifer]